MLRHNPFGVAGFYWAGRHTEKKVSINCKALPSVVLLYHSSISLLRGIENRAQALPRSSYSSNKALQARARRAEAAPRLKIYLRY